MLTKLLLCPRCQQQREHTVHPTGDGTAVVWCRTCMAPREVRLMDLERTDPPPR